MRARIVAAAASALLLPLAVVAQTAFEVVSVKPNRTGSSGWSVSYTADSWRVRNATLAAMIQAAYGIPLADRLVGGPAWVRTARFDVDAKASEALPRAELRLMAQRVLEDRFGLVLTTQQREQEVYSLRLAREDGRTGPDLRAADGCDPDAPVRTTPKSSTQSTPTSWGWCTTMKNLASGLSRSLGLAVVDQTGLPGRWDFVLAFSPLAPTAAPDVERAQTDLPTIFVAVEEQLGLTLDRHARGSVEYSIISAAREPAEN